jgi:hypothetical protein
MIDEVQLSTQVTDDIYTIDWIYGCDMVMSEEKEQKLGE